MYALMIRAWLVHFLDNVSISLWWLLFTSTLWVCSFCLFLPESGTVFIMEFIRPQQWGYFIGRERVMFVMVYRSFRSKFTLTTYTLTFDTFLLSVLTVVDNLLRSNRLAGLSSVYAFLRYARLGFGFGLLTSR